MIVDCIWPLAAVLGEGPIWHPREAVLWFVDIKGHALHRFDPATGETSSFPVSGEPGFVVPAADGSMIVGMDQGLYRFRDGAVRELVARVETAPGNRLNDATVDSLGRLWFGSMDNAEHRPTGELHRFDGRAMHRAPTAAGLCAITNGPAVSPDGGFLYHVDTLGGAIWRHRIMADGALVDGDRLIAIDPADGAPDGVVVDAEGCLWLGLWGGWSVRRYSPEGEMLASVAMPCANITKIAFGGSDLRTAFVTSARKGLDADASAAQPLAGGLFRFAVDTPGLPSHEVAHEVAHDVAGS